MLPDDDRVVVLGGFSGHGFKMSPAVGEIATDLVLDGGSAHDLGFASPARFQVISTVADRARARRPAAALAAS
jgi:sarcosine oxidase